MDIWFGWVIAAKVLPTKKKPRLETARVTRLLRLQYEKTFELFKPIYIKRIVSLAGITIKSHIIQSYTIAGY